MQSICIKNLCLKFVFFFFLCISFLCFASPGYANSDYIESLQQSAIDQKLWQKKEWINLLHYDVIDQEDEQYISQVDDNRFFNAKDGKTSSKAELLKTISAFFDANASGDNHALCRFIARFDWLNKQLSFNQEKLPVVHCKLYKEWREQVDADHITMVFPAYHLNSPSSMFGHTLLRVDKKFGNNQSDWLSYSISFGAETNTDDNSIFYAFKGLAGGYPGVFIVTPYFKKIQEYNRIENRDIWEYPLNITAEETHRMLQHLWELKEMNFDYFFFDENCSYRLLELLEVARPGIELTDDFELTAIPVDTVRAIERANLIQSISYRPSQATALQHLLNGMNEEEKALVLELAEDLNATESKNFKKLDAAQQHKIIDAAYKYIRYQQTGEARDPVLAKHSYQLLKKLNSYPASKPPIYNTPTSPELSHNSRRLSFSVGERLKQGYGELSYKFSFHDLEDNEHGFLRGAQINMGNIQLRANRHDTKLHQFDVIDIFSITPRTDFFQPLSWRVYTGWERQPTGLKDQLVSHVTGGAGVSYELWQDSQVYGLAMLRLEHNNDMNNSIEPGIGLLTGLLHHFGSSTAHIELSGEQFKDDIYRVRSSYTHNFVISTDHSLKLTARREWHSSIRFSELNLSYQYYF
ncbi:MAG: DUF4105 domain-containing protein [Gammaproteobacteria bacterium]|nr:DUF4105 domain-containing protein [Gammaproteobacteria bacterium]MCW8923874.1 DUF4105 domain-containing protein [Gammaproteobacteria bacterium]